MSAHLLPIARGALPETTALIGVSPNVGCHITDGDSALTTKFPFRSHCGLIGGTVMRRSAALTSHFPSQQGVDLSCQSVLRHHHKPRSMTSDLLELAECSTTVPPESPIRLRFRRSSPRHSQRPSTPWPC